MKPLQHARITAHRYGGEWQDWITVHDWIDRSKVIFPSMQHRMFIHSDFGEWLAVKIHGEAIGANDGTVISTRDLFHDHQVEDLGRVVTLAEWLREIDADYWTRRRGGVPGDYLALIDFFDKPFEFAPESPDVAAMITHNSFGIFLAEELLGTVIPLTETNNARQVPQIISTRSAAEDLVYARIGLIPPPGSLAAHTRLRLWMCGAQVGAALKTRITNERAAVERN
jgi:uncharacterized protein DUF6915